MADVAEEEADAAAMLAAAEDDLAGEDDTLPEGTQFVWRAWQALREDRYYGAYGGLTTIWFASVEAYARRYGIVNPSNFDTFHALLRSIDEEYVSITLERQRDEAKKNKPPPS